MRFIISQGSLFVMLGLGRYVYSTEEGSRFVVGSPSCGAKWELWLGDSEEEKSISPTFFSFLAGTKDIK